MKAEMIGFYLSGRAVKSLSRLRKFVADPDEIAAKIEEGTPVRQAMSDACDDAGKQIRADRKRKAAWVAEHKDELEEYEGADVDECWSAYIQGMCDELAYAYEADVLDALEGDDDDATEGDDDDGDDDDDDDDDDKDDKAKVASGKS